MLIHLLALIVSPAVSHATSNAPTSTLGIDWTPGPLDVTPLRGVYSSLVVFGDGFSDDGTGAHRLSNGACPPEGYYQGRWSNGKVWTEYLAEDLGIPLHSYAVEGATTSNQYFQSYTNGGAVLVPGIFEQVQAFIANRPADVDYETALFIVVGGASEAIFNNATAAGSAKWLCESFAALQSAGAKNFLTWMNPDLANLPLDESLSHDMKTALTRWSIQAGRLYTQIAKAYNATIVSVPALFRHFFFYGEPTKYGYDKYGGYGACVSGLPDSKVTICDNADKRVFWDLVYPTTKTHGYIAQVAEKQLLAGGVF